MKKYIYLSILVIIFSFIAGSANAAGYDFYVDAGSAEASEDGSEALPFKTIGAALLHIKNNNLKSKTIFVKKGTYLESVNVENNADLIGESESETVIDATGKKNAISFLSTKSEIRYLTIKNADASNVSVDKRSNLSIRDCTIKGGGKYGIGVDESSATNKYKFTLEDSTISENKSQGLYISKRKISLKGNEINNNEQEGIDLHSRVKGTVSGNNIHNNTESGIESILAGANLNIKNNKIEDNHAQGITVQAYSSKKKGKVKISKNSIKGNHDYGIRYANYTHSIGPKKFKVFVDKCVKLSGNTNKDNGDGDTVYE